MIKIYWALVKLTPLIAFFGAFRGHIKNKNKETIKRIEKLEELVEEI